MPGFKFRLQPVLDQRVAAEEEARKTWTLRQEEWRAEQRRLEEAKRKEQDLIARREHLRRNLMAPAPGENSLPSGGIKQRVEYVKALGLDIEAARDAVFSQKLVVEEAEEKVKEAHKHMLECQRQVEVLEKYRERLEQRWRRELERKEEAELDEIGQTLYSTRRRSS